MTIVVKGQRNSGVSKSLYLEKLRRKIRVIVSQETFSVVVRHRVHLKPKHRIPENFLENFGSVNAMVTKVQNLKESMRGTYRQNIGDSCKEHYIRLSVKQLLKVLLLELNF